MKCLALTIKKFILLALSISALCSQTYANETSFDDKSAVILTYQRIGEDHMPETNIRIEQFSAHIHELLDGDYNIIALPDLVTALKNNTPLPPRSIAITFDGGYRSVLDHAIPLLDEHKIPFTLFISTNSIKAENRYISTGDLKRLRKNKLVTLGLHPADYIRLARLDDNEIRRQINNAKTDFRKTMGKEAAFFAYPFGEYSTSYRNIVENSGFKAAFSQHSSVAYNGADIMTLPRFTMTEKYADLERFRLITNALPLPVKDLSPADPKLVTNKPVIGFTIHKDLENAIEKLSCFASNQDRPQIETVGSGRVELRLNEPFSEERARINCTLPGPQSEPGEPPVWRWFGLLMTTPEVIE